MESKALSFISIILLIFSFFASSKSQSLLNTIFPSNSFHGTWLHAQGDNDNVEPMPSPEYNSPNIPKLPGPSPAPEPPQSPEKSGPSPSPEPPQSPEKSGPTPSPEPPQSPENPGPSPSPEPPQSPEQSGPSSSPEPAQSPEQSGPSPSPDYNSPISAPASAPTQRPIPGGEWEVLQKFVGVSAMHMQLLHTNQVIIFDSTNFGSTNLSLPKGSRCKEREEFRNGRLPPNKEVDCSAHSFLYDITTNKYRPLVVQTNVWASSGALDPDGSLLQTGGYRNGSKKIRVFKPTNDDTCDWLEVSQDLKVGRYYGTTQILPDGRIIIVGGHQAPSYEFFPKTAIPVEPGDRYSLLFLNENTDPLEVNSLYPFLHLLPDGNLFVFANQHAVLLNYVERKIIRKYPTIPGARRSNPLTGSSVLLPLNLTGIGKKRSELEAEVMICGGAKRGAYLRASKGDRQKATKTCGRLKVTDDNPEWFMENMPMGRVMSDMVLLPTADVVIINGASKGSAMWEMAEEPVLHPVLYVTCQSDPNKRFVVMNPTQTPRLFQSTAILLPDGRILVGGSNPHEKYRFDGVKYATDTSLEAFSPHYLDPQYADRRPTISSLEGVPNNVVSYGQKFSVKLNLKYYNPRQDLMVTMIAPSFTTHSFAMNQRLLVLDCADAEHLDKEDYSMTVYAPPNKNIAPPGYYMMFVVHDGIPSPGIWVKMK
ncbi:hypothetical protein ACH5RR_030571 [Cinchona calisaya]|uniref:Galactose oxidase n=1 Tax=Cinchona calisaya TaxID=153742 RepID=A0ABD2YYH5_9GENT